MSVGGEKLFRIVCVWLVFFYLVNHHETKHHLRDTILSIIWLIIICAKVYITEINIYNYYWYKIFIPNVFCGGFKRVRFWFTPFCLGMYEFSGCWFASSGVRKHQPLYSYELFSLLGSCFHYLATQIIEIHGRSMVLLGFFCYLCWYWGRYIFVGVPGSWLLKGKMVEVWSHFGHILATKTGPWKMM